MSHADPDTAPLTSGADHDEGVAVLAPNDAPGGTHGDGDDDAPWWTFFILGMAGLTPFNSLITDTSGCCRSQPALTIFTSIG